MSMFTKNNHSGIPGMAALVAARTLAKYKADYYPKRDRITITFRGDIAENFGYDKIHPISAARIEGNDLVVIEGISEKTGATAHYCIECNGWNLIEAVDIWEPDPPQPAPD